MSASRIAALAVAATIAIAPATAIAAAKPSYRQLELKVRQTQKSRDTWKTRAGDMLDLRNETLYELGQAEKAKRDQAATIGVLTAQAASLKDQVTTLGGQVATLTGQRDQAVTQRDQALAGLPAAIAAVPIADFPRLVFTPARAAWPCDSLYSSGTYWSYSFDSPGC